MHTHIAEQTTFNYNSDGSGDVFINHIDGNVSVPFDDLLEFFAEFVRRKKICEIEIMSDKSVLGISAREQQGGD